MSQLPLARWEKLWHAATGVTPPPACFGHLVNRYSEPHRHYHTQVHICDCLDLFDTVRESVGAPAAVELAIWFHDAIYDPRAGDNEERSAAWAQDWLRQAGANPALVDAVTNLILTTKSHDAGAHVDAPWLVDVDLSILGQAPERFWEYERQIRAEYAWVAAELFAVKRAEILQRFLARPRLYHTKPFFDKFEKPARLNVQSALVRLRA